MAISYINRKKHRSSQNFTFCDVASSYRGEECFCLILKKANGEGCGSPQKAQHFELDHQEMHLSNIAFRVGRNPKM